MELKIFYMGLIKDFLRDLKNSSVGVEAFSWWLMLFWVVETFTINDVFLVDWDFLDGEG